MTMQDFAAEIEKARMLLQADYGSVTVSASMWRKSVFVSVKTPYWTHELELSWNLNDAPAIPLSVWICREVRLIRAPDLAPVKPRLTIADFKDVLIPDEEER